jgi:serine/threonine protein kinase
LIRISRHCTLIVGGPLRAAFRSPHSRKSKGRDVAGEREDVALPNLDRGPDDPTTVRRPPADSTSNSHAEYSFVAATQLEPTKSRPAAFGRYQVQRELGAGGFGNVYLGHDTQLDRPVAIKVLRASPSRDGASVEQALLEARKIAQMRHPGIITGRRQVSVATIGPKTSAGV